VRHRRFVAVAGAFVLISALVAPAARGADPASPPGPDLAVRMTGPTATPSRGDVFKLTILGSNVGAETATEVSMVAFIPDDLEMVQQVVSDPAMTCATGRWGQFECSVGSLAPGASASVTLTLLRSASRETWIDAWISSSENDANWENNSSGIYLEADRSNPADVRVQISAPPQPEVGERFTYASSIVNAGPEVARAVEFSQSISELADFVSVSSSDPTDSCSLFEETYDDEPGVEAEAPYTYREVRCELGSMQFAEETTITVDVIRRDPHELWSSAWVTTTSYDHNYDNDWADASTAGHPSITSDLIMNLTGPEGLPLVGDEFTYTLTVTNAGPAAAHDVMIDTWLPEQLALRAVTPTRDGDVCEQGNYQGITCTLGSLASGETSTVAIDVTRVGARRFWMGGSTWSSNYDPDWESNYAELEAGPDKSVIADLAVSMSGTQDPPVGSTFDHVVEVTNNGPDEAKSVSLNVSLPEGTEFISALSPDDTDVCTLFEETYDEEGMKVSEDASTGYTYREVRCSLGSLVPAERATVTVTLSRTHDYEMWASAWASTASFDNDYENDWASIGSLGGSGGGCGPAEDSEGGFIACDTAERGGSGESYAATSEPGKHVLKGGRGGDSITLRIPTHSKRHREIVVAGGRGRDKIKVFVAPGAGNVTLILKGGAGRDSIEVIARRPGKNFKLRMWGGAGNDSCSSLRGDRQRSRAC